MSNTASVTTAPAETAAAPPRLLLTAGEPAGIGPELLVRIAQRPWPAQLVAVADPDLLRARAAALNLPLQLRDWQAAQPPRRHRAGELPVLAQALAVPSQPGRLDTANAAQVLACLRSAVTLCSTGAADALVTAPLHKGVINDAGVRFTGHTEFLAEQTGAAMPVMLLMAPDAGLRVALVTTHLPLRAVAEAITPARLTAVVQVLHRDLVQRFGIAQARILVTGLNPHAGESGHLGDEEQRVIAPALEALRAQGMQLSGPVPADTAFTPGLLAHCDAVLAMYHDQGLTALKYAGFGRAVNVTLGLPIIRTSVDHGTALDLAARGGADSGSLEAAVQLAIDLVQRAAAPAA